jgi:cephalosporin-C deacetylase
MKRTLLYRLIVLLAALVWAGGCRSQVESVQGLVVTPQKADGIYKIGETIHWQINCGGVAPDAEASYTLRRGGLTELSKGTLPLIHGAASLEASLDEAGALLLEVIVKDTEGQGHKAVSGAVVAPDKIAPSAPRPDDFDAFWDAKLQELADVPANPQLELAESGRAGVDYWRITLDNIRGTHIHGQLARPTEGEKLPALLIPQWAGVYPLEKPWATDRAAEGWLVLNIMAHDLPIDEPAEFYKEQYAGPLENYWAIGNDDRETSYFLRMYLACYRAAEYLASRPDWDGKTLVVAGASQGGQQTLVTAGLNPRITAALPLVPAGCDMLGPEVGRRGGWPQWYNETTGKDPAKVHEASRYYDPVNFASRITCPVLIGLGLIDDVCPPEGVLAAANQIAAPKEVVVLPRSGHQDVEGSQQPYYDRCYGAWLPALREGKPAPVIQP